MRRTRFAKGFHSGHKKGQNKTEASYAAYLHGLKVSGQIVNCYFESITLKLSNNVRYTPDFLVEELDGTLTCVEVKAGMKNKTGEIVPISEDASRVKLNIAAEAFPFRFQLAYLYKGVWYWKDFIVP